MNTPEDEVDIIVAAWQSQRPDLDVEPLAVLSRITRLAHHLDRARAEAFEAHDLENWEFDVLAALRRAGTPFVLSAGELMRQTHVTSGSMTNRINRLTTSKLVNRLPDPADGRGVLIELTSEGLARVDAAISDLLEREHAILDVLPKDQRAALANSLKNLISPFTSEDQ
jgi:DNA-binding MarR family transcriptional regulator